MPATKMLQKLNQKEVWFVIATLSVTIGVAALSAAFHWGWRSGFALSFGMYGLLALFAITQRDRFLKRLLLFGIAAGFIELFADCWLVKSTGTLLYPNQEPMIACSPLYMPFAWAVILIQVGYLGWLISREEKLAVSILATAVIGLAVIPMFEHWAKKAGWWYYVNCKMIFNTPWYIIIGEGLLCSVLPLFFSLIHRKNYPFQILTGFAEGAWIWVSYLIGYFIAR